MENIVFTGETNSNGEELDPEQEAFMSGYTEDEKIEECAECGAAIRPDKKVVREINGETLVFCSEECAKEFEESATEE
jgi:hypothetical protein